MKKIFNLALAGTMILATALTSCKKDSDSSSPAGSASLTAGQSLVKANISGAHSTNFESTNTISTAAKAGGLIVITANKQPSGTNLTVDNFVIYLPANITTGSYKVTDVTSGIFQFGHTPSLGAQTKGWQADDDGETVFNFTVTKVSDTEIEGTFSGDMTNDTDMTVITASGSFAAKFKP